jgi:hypothetical protein
LHQEGCECTLKKKHHEGSEVRSQRLASSRVHFGLRLVVVGVLLLPPLLVLAAMPATTTAARRQKQGLLLEGSAR